MLLQAFGLKGTGLGAAAGLLWLGSAAPGQLQAVLRSSLVG